MVFLHINRKANDYINIKPFGNGLNYDDYSRVGFSNLIFLSTFFSNIQVDDHCEQGTSQENDEDGPMIAGRAKNHTTDC